ncbi:Os05g0469900, partial [Oryza sativa Japonica Group]
DFAELVFNVSREAERYMLPKGTIEAIDKRRHAFLWSGEDSCHGSKCLVAWDLVCKSKSLGGLGIKNLHSQNICLLTKMIYRLFSQNSPWTK